MFAQFIFNGKRKAATQENLPELMSKPCSIQTTTRNCSSSNNEIKPSTKELVAMNRISGYLQAPGRASTVAEFNDYLKKLRQIDEPSGLGVFLVLIASLLSIQTKDRGRLGCARCSSVIMYSNCEISWRSLCMLS